MTLQHHVLCQFGGRLLQTEEWSCGLRISLFTGTWEDTPAPFEAWCEAQLEDVATDVRAWFVRAFSHHSQEAHLDYVKLNSIGPDGHYTSGTATNVKTWLPSAAGNGTQTVGYPQDTLVASLCTDVQRGYAHRGRIYPPTGWLTPNSWGRVQETACGEVAGSLAQLVTDLNNQPGLDVDDPRVVVVSNYGSPGPVHEVTRIQVGNVMDTQRRRRKSMPEEYQEAVVA